jgi:hypothetical protein
MEEKKPFAILTSFADGEVCNLCSPDGTKIVFEDDYYLVITPEGYQFQLELSEQSVLNLDKLDNYNGKQLYEQLERKIKEK